MIMLRTRRYGEDTIENKEDDLKNVIIFVANLNEDGIFRNIVSFVWKQCLGTSRRSEPSVSYKNNNFN